MQAFQQRSESHAESAALPVATVSELHETVAETIGSCEVQVWRSLCQVFNAAIGCTFSISVPSLAVGQWDVSFLNSS